MKAGAEAAHERSFFSAGRFLQRTAKVLGWIFDAEQILRDAPLRRHNDNPARMRELLGGFIVKVAEADRIGEPFNGSRPTRQKMPAPEPGPGVSEDVRGLFVGSPRCGFIGIYAYGDHIVVRARRGLEFPHAMQQSVQDNPTEVRASEIGKHKNHRLAAEDITQPHGMPCGVGESFLQR